MTQKSINWGNLAPHPIVIIILGDIGSGKTCTACDLLDYYHQQEIKCFIIAPKDIHKAYVESASWIGILDPESLKLEENSVYLVDDAHLMFSARAWYKEGNTVLDNLIRESRHFNVSFIHTSQQSTVLDRNIISMPGCVIIKRPSILQKESERPFVRKIMKDADQRFNALKVESFDDYKHYAYVISRHLPSPVMIKVEKPEWFTDDISKAYRRHNFRPRKKSINVKKFFVI